MPDGKWATISGDRDTQGLPSRIRQIVTGSEQFDPAADNVATFDDQGRVIEVANAADGSLRIEYGEDGAARFTWRDPDTWNEFEVVVPNAHGGAGGATALNEADPEEPRFSPLADSIESYGEIEVTCTRSGVSGPFGGASLGIERVLPDINGAPGGRDSVPFKEVSPGIYRYPRLLANFDTNGQSLVTRLGILLGDACRNPGRVFESTLRTLPGVLQTELANFAGLTGPISLLLGRIQNLALFAFYVTCDIKTFSEQAFNEIAKEIRLSKQIFLTAQARTALHFSPRVSWDYQLGDATVPKQTIVMPELACPARPLEGRWVGELRQPGNFRSPLYRYEITLDQQGESLDGSSYIAMAASPQYFGEIRITGTARPDSIVLRDAGVVRENIPQQMFWCTKTGTYRLRHLNGQLTMSGPWSAVESSCAPGETFLRRADEPGTGG